MGDWCFAKCYSLKYVNIPEKLDVLPKGTFYGCKELKKVVLPDNLKEIGDFAFYGCSNLHFLRMKNKIVKVGMYFCAKCDKLKLLELSNELAELPEGGVRNCLNLKSFGIPTKTKFVDKTFAMGCKKTSTHKYVNLLWSPLRRIGSFGCKSNERREIAFKLKKRQRRKHCV